MVQTLLSSSYLGYGTVTLDQDAAELRDLVTFLREDEAMGGEGYALIGHSTGTQDCVRFVRNVLWDGCGGARGEGRGRRGGGVLLELCVCFC